MLEDSTLGYLAFNVWMLPMIRSVQTGLEDLRARGMKSLVLDLRGNPGGVSAMAVAVARMFLQHGGSLGTLRFREFTQEFKVQAEADPFTGPVAVLVDEGTASTSEIFLAGMQELGRVQVFGGGPTAGAALPSVIEELPGGAMLQYVVGEYRTPGGKTIEGRGITPDVRVPERRSDYVAGRDPVLEAATTTLKEHKE
jgi:carboxyl-terminal processing protease